MSFRGHFKHFPEWIDIKNSKGIIISYRIIKVFQFSSIFTSFRIIDQSSSTEIASFPIYKVLFCVRGQNGTLECDCFAFTESYSGTEEFQIHVFSCEIKEAVSRNHDYYFFKKQQLK